MFVPCAVNVRKHPRDERGAHSHFHPKEEWSLRLLLGGGARSNPMEFFDLPQKGGRGFLHFSPLSDLGQFTAPETVVFLCPFPCAVWRILSRHITQQHTQVSASVCASQ